MNRPLSILLAAALLVAGCSSTPEEEAPPGSQAAALYESARAARDRGDFVQAVQQLEQLEAQYPFGVYAEQAQLDIIYAYHKMGEADSAVAAADRFIQLNPRHPEVGYARYMKGVAEHERGDHILLRWFDLERSQRDPEPLRRAFDAFRALLERHPDSPYADDARRRMVEIRDLLADHELGVARFYADRSAWVAAANRASAIVTRYPGTAAVDDALGILQQAYDELGMDGLGEDVRRVIRLNFPEQVEERG